MRKLLTLGFVLLAGAALYWFITVPGVISVSAFPAHAPNAANGKTMFDAGGCTSCHGSNKEDRLMLGGGMDLPSPFGIFRVPNISQNPVDGIGRWTESQFATAMLKGTSPDGRHYFPAFPYASYAKMKIEDVRDLYAYLKTLPQAAGRVDDHSIRFPFNIRRNVGGWKFLFFDDKTFVADNTRSPQWNRGAYLVNGPGHCAECHSPRNALGGTVKSQRYAGGPNPEGEGWVPNITQKGLVDWSEKDFATFLETGELPGGDSTGGAMVRVIANMSQLGADDRMAMAVYLKSLAPVEGPKRPGKS